MKTGRHDLAQLRSLQDYNVKLALESVPGVSQVASLGGFVKQYQMTIDPNRLLAYNIPLMKVMEAVKKSNRDVEGRVLEFSGIEYMVRGRGYIKRPQGSREHRCRHGRRGTPIYLKDVAEVRLGPEIRRGLADLDGQGEVAAGIVVVRFGENVLNVIDRVKEKIRNDIAPSLPKGVEIVTTYDRSDLIRALHRHAQGGDHQARHRGERGLHRLSLPPAERSGGDSDAPGCHHHFLHLHVLPGASPPTS